METDFNYYFVQYKDGKITNLIKQAEREEPVATDGSKTIRATSNEYNLLKAVEGNVAFAQQIVEDYAELLAKAD